MKKWILIATTSLLMSPLAWAGALETNTTIADPAPAYVTQDNPNVRPTADDNGPLFINDHLKVVPKTYREENSELHYTIEVTYPEITGPSLPEEAEKFNERMASMVDQSVMDFKGSVKEDAAHQKTLPEDIQKNTLKIDYDIDVFHPENLDLISVRLSEEGMLGGHAHPYHAHQVMNFDFTHGQELALQDLFKSHADFLQALAKYSQQQLNQTVKQNDQWMIAEGTKPVAKNFKNWNIEEDAILITFDEYQVAPYYYGTLEVEIPYTDLKNILSSKAMIISSLSLNGPSKKLG